MRHDPATCGGCPFCESQAEARAEAEREAGDDAANERDYEAYLDRIGGSL